MDKLDKEKQKKGLAPEKESEKSEENLVPPKIDKPAPTTIKSNFAPILVDNRFCLFDLIQYTIQIHLLIKYYEGTPFNIF